MASEGAPKAGSMPASSSSSSSRDSEMASKLQSATSLTIRALQEMTDDFSEQRKIGQGAYGKVYVAKLENGEEVAVKVLYNNTPGIDDEQFQREFENLMRLEHQNIVRLVAYCYETQRQPMQHEGRTIFTERTYRALCFEYMQNGSLQKHLSDECVGLDWLTRYKIIKGAWKGLKHLHEGFEEPIYHLDIKPDNILLDKNMVPKLADFGLSKLFSDKQTMTTNSPIGTIGYLPMEFLHGNIISNKFDIFSLGVVMVKIIAGHGGYARSAEMPRQEFLDQVNENWRNRMLKTCQVSRQLEAYCEQVNICTEIALSCMAIDRHKRPNITDIIHRLNDTEAVIDKALSWTANTHSMMNGDLVKLEALTKSEAIPCAQTSNGYPILARVTAPPCEEMPCAGLDLVIVLDWGWKAQNAIQQIMHKLIDLLRPNDRVSIMSEKGPYNGTLIFDKLTFMDEEGRDAARLTVNRVSPLYSYANIADSLRDANKILNGRQLVEDGDNRVGFIVVLSRAGCSESRILPKNISSKFQVHTFSLESSYFYAYEYMKYIADKSAGTYSFIDVNVCDFKDAFELLISGIRKVVARSIKITLAAHEGVAIASIESGRYNSRVNSGGQSGQIDINDIYAGETKNFIVKLKVAEGKGKLVTIGGQYWSLNVRKQLTDMDVFVLRPRLGCSPEKLTMHHEVAAELLRVQLAKGLSAILEDPPIENNTIEKLRDKIKSSALGRNAPQETVAVLHKLMEMPTYRDPYVMSWLSCHEWQRATTKGSYSDSGDFTPKC